MSKSANDLNTIVLPPWTGCCQFVLIHISVVFFKTGTILSCYLKLVYNSHVNKAMLSIAGGFKQSGLGRLPRLTPEYRYAPTLEDADYQADSN